ncbi:hypothetical protein NTA49_10465 [Photobacterium sp. TY 1-4]|uniref:Lipoprotein n=2 Tax=Pseudosulfitobacter koreensis TaxID=2968472 RepID=A0ABT1Z1I1_9RHOB|nr:hypothetical protein [Pseudosulfitobacter koreense]
MKHLIPAFVLLVAACNGSEDRISNDDISRDVATSIALCSSGIEIEDSVRAELNADLRSILEEGGGSLDAEAAIASSIRGLVFTPEVLSDTEGQKSFEIYTKCVTDNLATYLPDQG